MRRTIVPKDPTKGTTMTAQQTTQTTTRATHSDQECRAIACEFLVEVLGALPSDLTWDSRHHLQGHAHVGEREVVVIAPRDDQHRPVLVTAEDWDAIRAADSGQRAAVLAAAAITDRRRLPLVLGDRQGTRLRASAWMWARRCTVSTAVA